MNDAALREFIDGAAARQLAPSLVVGVVDADRERFVHAAGLRDVAHSSPLAPDAIFRIASMTKPVTSLAAMMLAEDGAIGIEEPAARYLPELEGLRVLTAFDEATGRWESSTFRSSRTLTTCTRPRTPWPEQSSGPPSWEIRRTRSTTRPRSR